MTLKVLSLGAGVQSSVMGLMASCGEIEAPEFAVFADTQAEPASVYKWLDWLEGQLSFPVIRATYGSLEHNEGQRRTRKRDGARYLRLDAPYWAWDGVKAGGPMGRNCTRDYKVRIINREIRKHLGITNKKTPPGVLAESWLGISTDEAHRMKPSRDKWVSIRWPLIDAGMSRKDCIRWMVNKGLPLPPRSACVFCPFHSPEEWMRLQLDEPAEYARACAHEDRLRAGWAEWSTAKDMTRDFFMQRHVPGVPLREINWAEFIASKPPVAQLSMWGNECEGMCGI